MGDLIEEQNESSASIESNDFGSQTINSSHGSLLSESRTTKKHFMSLK